MKFRNLFQVLFVIAVAALLYWRLDNETRPVKRTVHEVPARTDTETELANLPSTFPLALTDSSGRLVSIPSVPRRIVSLAPSCTELLYDLGVGARIVADSTADDYPAEAAKKPHVGGYGDISVERVLAHNPDLIVVDSGFDPDTVVRLATVRVPLLVLEAHTLVQIYDTVRMVGRATGQNLEADRTVAQMKQKLDRIRKAVGGAVTRPTVAILYGADPIYTAGPGTFLDDLVKIAGGHNIVERPVSQISSEELIAAQPDVILCDESIRSHVETMPGWKERIPAVAHSAFFCPSENATVVRAVPRLADAAEELAHFLHPELFTSDGQPAPLPAAPHP